MAKAKRSTKGSKTKQTRVHPIDARANALRSSLGLTPGPNLASDRRQPYSPDYTSYIPTPTPEASVQVVFGSPAETKRASKVHPHIAPVPVVRPEKTICSRRQERKEVIHAFNHSGKAGQKTPVRTPNSNIHCKG